MNNPASLKDPLEDQQQEQEQQEFFFNLIQKVGSMGRYQLTLFLTLSIISLLSGGVILMTPFLFYEDKYDCSKLDTPYASYKDCLDQICQFPLEARSKYFPDQLEIHSFASKFGDFRCPDQQAQLDLIKSFFYSGQLVAFFVASVIGDIFRTKIMIVGGLGIGLVGIIIAGFSSIFALSAVGLFLIPVGIITSYNLTYIFITEIVEEGKRQTYKILVASLFSVGALTNVLWFLMIPNYEIVMLVFFGLPMLAITIIFLVFFKDTPISLISKNSPEKAYQNLMHIAKINGIDNPDLTLEEVKEIQNRYKRDILRKSVTSNKSKKFTFIDLFRYKSLRIMTITLIFVDCVFVLQYLTPTLMLNQFDFNVFVSGSVIEASQILVSIFGYLAIYRVPRRISGMISFTIIMICSIILVFIWDQNGSDDGDSTRKIVVLIFIFVIEMVVSNSFNFYAIYLNELFPTQVRVIGTGFIKTWGSLTSMVSSQIINACLNGGFSIMLLFAILAAFSIFLSYLLPETHGKRPPEMVDELAAKDTIEGSLIESFKVNVNEKENIHGEESYLN